MAPAGFPGKSRRYRGPPVAEEDQDHQAGEQNGIRQCRQHVVVGNPDQFSLGVADLEADGFPIKVTADEQGAAFAADAFARLKGLGVVAVLTIIDRQMLGAFFKAYVVCLVSMLSLYVVVDLFTNLDDFTGKNKSWQRVAIDIGAFYGYRLSQIFDRLCEAIVLLAAMFTIAWTQRNNELVPLLSCGVSVHRVVAPVLGGAFALGCAIIPGGVGNTEQQIDAIAHDDARAPDGPQRDAARPLLLFPALVALGHDSRRRPPLGHRNTNDHALLDRQLRPLHRVGSRRCKQHQDGMNQAEPLLGVASYWPTVEPSMNSGA